MLDDDKKKSPQDDPPPERDRVIKTPTEPAPKKSN